ncbi:MAG TPA: hypothetical protein VFL78_07660, partial [Rhodanobacteraceae bacterium]|nr:hypothetical protein [Rhodanobacteraceae bacterium]
GLGSFGLRNSLYSVVRDVEQTVPVQMFTPANSWDFSYSRTFIEPPHALRVKFTNPEANDQEDTRLVYWDGYNEDGSGGNTKATIFEELDARQTIDPDAAWHLGRYHLAVMHLRPTTYSWMADIENLVCERGDLVHTSYDLIGWGKAWGRVKAVDGTTVTLDGPVELDSSKTYAFRVRTGPGTGAPDADGYVIPEQATQTISSWSSDSHATSADATKFARGNGSDDKFQLYDANGRAVTKDATITAIHQTDWQGRVELSNEPRTNLVNSLTAASMSSTVTAAASSFIMPSATPATRYTFSSGSTGYIQLSRQTTQSNVPTIFVAEIHYVAGSGYFGIQVARAGDSAPRSIETVNVLTGATSPYATFANLGNDTFLIVVTLPATMPAYDIVGALFITPAGNPVPASYDGASFDIGAIGLYANATTRGAYTPPAVTVTDYTDNNDGTIALGQAPQGESSPGAGDAAVLDWTGTGTVEDPIDTLTLAGEIPDMEPGDLFLIGEVNHGVAPLIITKIEPDNDLTAKITAVDAAPGIWTADSGTPPAFVSDISGKAWCAPPKPPVVHIYASNSAPNNAGVIDSQANVSNGSPSSGIYRFVTHRGGGGCPAVDAIVRMADGTDKRAGDIKVGDAIVTADPVTLQPGVATVRYSETKLMPCVEIETRNRALICSVSAPIPTRRDGLKLAPDVAGRDVATLEGWHQVTVLRSAGARQVQHIDINDGCFWCNGILHHNKRARLSVDNPNFTPPRSRTIL